MSDKVIFHSVKDKTVNNLINKISDRAAKSNAKHNNTIDNVNKSTLQWLNESLEEAMDLCVYLQRAIELTTTFKKKYSLQRWQELLRFSLLFGSFLRDLGLASVFADP